MKLLAVVGAMAVLLLRASPAAAQHHGRGGHHHAVHQDHVHHAPHYHGAYQGYPYYVGAARRDVSPSDVSPSNEARLATVVAAPRPTFGIGLWTSSARLQGDAAAEGYGIMARIPGRRVEVELEIGKDRFRDRPMTSTRVGGAVLIDLTTGGLTTGGALVPYVLAGLGVNLLDAPSGTAASRQGYLEAGAGLALRLTGRLRLSADLRLSARRSLQSADCCAVEPAGSTTRTTTTTSPSPFAQRQSGVEGRLALIYYF